MSSPTIIVTGGFGALGQGLARTLADQGARLALLDAAPAIPPAVAQAFGDQLLLPGVDLSQPDATRAAVNAVAERYGSFNGLVNVAGGFRWETIDGGDPATWQSMFSINLLTALHACQAVLPHLAKAGGGRIVNVGAGAAAKAGLGMGAYAASKAGVLRLTEALAEEVKDKGITVNAVLPSIIDTPANRRDMPQADFSRWVTAEALADVIAFLLSDAARAITGAGIPVNGRV
ncbi:SDR family NAD(P)-dependent oxidoreductase [Aquincola sp. S2]|uniref:SDR family NAD(P)-dependent oxidoreductase n=1 Tax=Pseudaquabacterium terrae TaxID=2732868 RepID=A0ABX2EPB5_9BURK|nr:SDR family NAD(P)-dependent oxidoreductase [Aquabacterium terrae]NRF70423.1 SDR family NAD(P)-dependent oxidoreductase [Aquabacterium terrae]